MHLDLLYPDWIIVNLSIFPLNDYLFEYLIDSVEHLVPLSDVDFVDFPKIQVRESLDFCQESVFIIINWVCPQDL